MKNMISTMIAAFFALAVAQAAANDEKSAVQKVVEEAYVQGVHANPSGDAMRKGFHQDFVMFVFRDGKHVFSDYLSLYKFEDGWKIIGKIFYRHPAS